MPARSADAGISGGGVWIAGVQLRNLETVWFGGGAGCEVDGGLFVDEVSEGDSPAEEEVPCRKD